MFTKSGVRLSVLGDFMRMERDFFCLKMSVHVKVEFLSKNFVWVESNSPILKLPKKAVRHAVHNTCLSRTSLFNLKIFFCNVLSFLNGNGSVIGFISFVMFEEFLLPLIKISKRDFENLIRLSPFILWILLKARM